MNTLDKIIYDLQCTTKNGNDQCDGAFCTGCWKDIVRESIKDLEAFKADNQDKWIKVEPDFIEYLKNSRKDFVIAVRDQEWNTELRVVAEDFIIAFDQAVNKFSLPNPPKDK